MIPKKGDQKLLQNKRPICLLDVVYKIAAKVLANRMSKVIDKLVFRDQTGAIKGRYIGENLRTIADVINYGSEDDIEGILMALDFKNAYNTVEYSFLAAVLRRANFGPEFIQWITLLHTDMEVAVSNNGFTSSWLNVSRGLQQGSPTSGLLFALVVEIVAVKVRENRNIHGIVISGCEVKLTQYCDDMTVFVASEQDGNIVLDTITGFGAASGLELNRQKSHCMRIGRRREESTLICGFEPVDTVKILGVHFSATSNCDRKNIDPAINKIKRILNAWSQRDLTLKGAITVSKSLVVSQLTYIMTCSKIEEDDVALIQSLIMKFLWRGRPPKVAKRTLTQGIDEGGLKAPDLRFIYQSLRAGWARRIVNTKQAAFSKIFLARIQPLLVEDVLKMNYGEDLVDQLNVASFYKDVLRQFRSLCPVPEPRCGSEVRRQYLWHNKTLNVDGKPIFHSRLYRNGIKQVNDFLDDAGQFLSYQAFQAKFPAIRMRLNPLTYMGWGRVMPRQWRMLAVDGSPSLTEEDREEAVAINYKGKTLSLCQVTCHHLYQLALPLNKPTAQLRWEEEGVDFGERWVRIYRLPYEVTTSTRLQTLQYRIVHRYFPTRRFLYSRKVIDDPFCDDCGLVDSLYHYFFECHEVHSFWNDLIVKVNVKLPRQRQIKLTRVGVLFGFPRKLPVVNLLMLVAKQFLASQKYRQGAVTYEIFYPNIVKMFSIEKEIARKNGKTDKFMKKWKPFISADGMLDL